MTPADQAEFGALLRATYALYRAEFSGAVIAIWWEAMRAFDLAAVRDALGRHAMNPDAGQFLPRPADVVRMLCGSTLDAALVAWTRAMDAVASVGTYETVCFDDPITQRVIAEMGGWIALGAVTERELPFRQREFEARYRAYRARSEVPEHPAALPGIFDRDNGSHGYQAGEPRLIGDAAKALAVHRSGTEGSGQAATPLSIATRRFLESRP